MDDPRPVSTIEAILSEYPQVMTVGEVAAVLRFSPGAIRAMAAEGRIPAHKIGSREWRILKRDIADLLGSEDSSPPGQPR